MVAIARRCTAFGVRLVALVLALSMGPVGRAGARPVATPTAPADPAEVRALWVDAFHAGIRSPAEADALVATARRANLNTLFVQVRRRGDALYTKGIEPPLDDPAYDPAFDALAYVLDAAHRAGLEVHAWVNAMPTWRDEAPPRDPRHLFNRHGPSAPGDDNWFTAGRDGTHKFPVGYFLDPGHPGAAAYLAGIYVDLVRQYAIDGLHFDYIRYPETDGRLPRGAEVGYNRVSVRRFRRAAGRTDTPDPGDEAWIAWRREQVTHLVRRVSIEARAVNPRIKISAALIPWGQPPTGEGDFADVAPMQRVFQDWHGWLQEGLVDLAVPMNYARETDARVRAWFDGWLRWEKRHKHGRQLAAGLGAYRNTPADTLAQVARARKREGGASLDGVSFFSYAAPQLPPAVTPDAEPPSALDPEASGTDRLAFLADGVPGVRAAFPRPAAVPAMPWILQPRRGWIAGTVEGRDADGATVKVRRAGFPWFARTRTLRADGNGYFGTGNLAPGRYRVLAERDGRAGPGVDVRVAAGRVAHKGSPRAPALPVRVLIAYHSETGHTEQLARAVREGAAAVDGVEVLLRPVAAVTDAEILAADGILVGTPVHWGTVSTETKRFVDRVGNTLFAAKSSGEGRTAGAFATGGSDDGGLELARLTLLTSFLGMRFIAVGSVSEDGFGRLGAEAAVAPPATAPSQAALARARAFGERFARLTRQIRSAVPR